MKINFTYLNSLDWDFYYTNDQEYFRSRTNEYDFKLSKAFVREEGLFFNKQYIYSFSLDIKERKTGIVVTIAKDIILKLWHNLIKDYEINRENFLKEIDL